MFDKNVKNVIKMPRSGTTYSHSDYFDKTVAIKNTQLLLRSNNGYLDQTGTTLITQ